jgi:hypothetical protein
LAKAINVAFNCLIQRFSGYTINAGKVCVEDDLLAADGVDDRIDVNPRYELLASFFTHHAFGGVAGLFAFFLQESPFFMKS